MRSAIILAAGKSQRYGENKLFKDILGKPLIVHTVEKFRNIADEIILVTNTENALLLKEFFGNSVRMTTGGESRTRSVINGLQCVDPSCSVVAIHDGARPFVSQKLIKACYEIAESKKSAVPVIQPADSVLLSGQPVPREDTLLIQTPQVFDYKKIVAAYAKFPEDRADDSAVWIKAYGSVTYVEGERTNIKITYPGDIMTQRTGYGYDIHKLVKNRALILGGVNIPFERGLLGHSDADVVAHSIMDALLSAAGEKDIGHHFPDKDPTYKDISSMMLMQKVADILNRKRIYIQNISAALVCEKPRISPYIQKMKENISDALGISPYIINISVTTAEGIGEIGRGKAIACRSSALISIYE